MSDQEHKIATDLWKKIEVCEHTEDEIDLIAQALRDVQRETAEECCKLILPPSQVGSYYSRALKNKVRAIRERFNLKD